ncbi:MAG: DUF378 domain-containing protein [Bacillota bacterium]
MNLLNKFDKAMLILVIIGALNWGAIGFFDLNFISNVFGGPHTTISRIIFAIIGLAGIWAITFPFQIKRTNKENNN